MTAVKHWKFKPGLNARRFFRASLKKNSDCQSGVTKGTIHKKCNQQKAGAAGLPRLVDLLKHPLDANSGGAVVLGF
jgi:hypothetical protein